MSSLTTLLSQALVAYTVEFDNEFEHQMPQESQVAHRQLLRHVEDQWESRFGTDVTGPLRESLETLVGDERGPRLFPALEPYPDGWRASVQGPGTLPHLPMVLDRGGYPDGS